MTEYWTGGREGILYTLVQPSFVIVFFPSCLGHVYYCFSLFVPLLLLFFVVWAALVVFSLLVLFFVVRLLLFYDLRPIWCLKMLHKEKDTGCSF